MRKFEPAPELTGRDFIAAGIVSVGILLVMIVIGTLSDTVMTETGEFDGAQTRIAAGNVD